VISPIVGETTTERCQNRTAKLALRTASAISSQLCVCRKADINKITEAGQQTGEKTRVSSSLYHERSKEQSYVVDAAQTPTAAGPADSIVRRVRPETEERRDVQGVHLRGSVLLQRVPVQGLGRAQGPVQDQKKREAGEGEGRGGSISSSISISSDGAGK
jgi:hypothetical protein